MPLSAQRDRVIGDASLYLLQAVVESRRIAAHFVWHSSSHFCLQMWDFSWCSGLVFVFSLVFDDTLRFCNVGQVVILRGSLNNQHCGRLHRTSPALVGLHRKKTCFLGGIHQFFILASLFLLFSFCNCLIAGFTAPFLLTAE